MHTKRTIRGLAVGAALISLMTLIFAWASQPVPSIDAQDLVETHVNAEDYVWDNADITTIALNGDSITFEGSGAVVDGSIVTITSAGNYSLSGTLNDGQIIVDTSDEAIVRLILNGVNVSSSTSAPIYIANAEKVMIVLADGSENTVVDALSYVFASPEEDEPNAAVFAKSDLTIYGNGALTVTGNYNDGIASKDGLVITSGTIIVNAVDDGIRGKDYLVVETGSLTINAGGDGLKSDNEEDAGRGYISIESGVITVTAGGDAITAQTNALITSGTFTLTSGGGSTAYASDTVSAKGIKAAMNVQIDGGTFQINAADDGLHSNANMTVNGGDFTIASGDDGAHADTTLTINGGDIVITDSYEGLESALITLNGGNIQLVSSDDGVNISGGNDGSGMARGGGRGGQDQFSPVSTNQYLYINGGYLIVDARGDGLDANGAIEMTGGGVIVNGPTEQMNGALDFDAGFNMTGGWLIAAGSAGMVQTLNETSTQASLLLNLNTVQPAGTLIHIQSSDGTNILTFAPSKEYQSITFSSPELTQGTSYQVYLGGSSDGMMSDGLYEGGSYSGGALYTDFTVNSVITILGNAGMGRGFGRP